MNTRRPLRAILLLPILLAALGWAAPAQSAERVGLSLDGVSWASELAFPLFEVERRWVPGDGETRTFHVRNQGPSAATLAIEALSPGGDPVFAADVALDARVDGGPWRQLTLGRPAPGLTVQPLEVDHVVPVEIRAVFDPASSNATQDRSLPLSLRVVLDEDVLPEEAGGSDDAPDRATDGANGSSTAPGGLLPGTGGPLGLGILVGAAALCLLGAYLLARRSNRDDAPAGVLP